jgi:pyruvate/2-oxoglutarate dehydrogenase complex dihydrolipoamide acyltransferase (E2) component
MEASLRRGGAAQHGTTMLARMSMSEKPAPLDAAEPPVASLSDHESSPVEDGAAAAVDDPDAALSPAVRRLVRQFDLDITGIRGTGPEGRIRVGDVMNLLGGRTDSGKRIAGYTGTFVAPADTEPSREGIEEPVEEPVDAPVAPHALTAATTTVFECDLSRVLAHRKKLRLDNVDVLLTSYFVCAISDALGAVAGVAPDVTSLGLEVATTDGATRTALIAIDGVPDDGPSERALEFDAALKEGLDADIADADLVVHHYGESGSLLATPTPLDGGRSVSVGIGRVRREIVVRTVDGVEQPRVTARCYVSLSFLADRIAFDRANRFLAHAVRVLEQWPD